MRAPLAAATLLLLTASACSGGPDDGFAEPTPPPQPVDPDDLCNTAGASRCSGFDYEVCVEGRWFRQETCAAPTPQCDPDSGCVACTPETDFCVGRDVYTCNEDGTAADHSLSCESGEECLFGACYDACTLAEQTESYLGCRFLSVPTANILDAAFWDDFAIVVANPSDEDSAQIQVRAGGQTVAADTVAPGTTAAISLDLDPELQIVLEQQEALQSVVAGRAAFEVTSSVPIAAYQYNPLHFVTVSDDGKNVSSFTNDASLLLPEHVLTGNYRVSTWPTWGIGAFPGEAAFIPGFVAVAATEDDTEVTFRSAANTAGGPDFGALEIGAEQTVELDRGDVLQVLSEVPAASLITNVCAERGGDQGTNLEGSDNCLDRVLGDLTGSVVSATAPVAVFAGHVCTFVPFDRYACDHLEEMMFPSETWGRGAVMTAVHEPGGFSGSVVPAWYRILSAADGNIVTFTPADVADSVVLNTGEHLEFLAHGDFVVDGTGPLYVTQALLGERALGTNSGDPALGSGIPIAQWRSEYDFLVPDTYTSHYVNVAAPDGAEVYLDGLIIEGWEAVEDADYVVARIELEPGPHRVESVDDVGFGITSYGYAAYTSYLHPGGMNFLR